MARSYVWRDLDVLDFDAPRLSEPPLARRRRINQKAKDGKRAIAVDRSGSPRHLERAAKSLKHVNAQSRVLRVPHWDMEKAEAAMRAAGVSGSVRNLCGSQSKRVKKR
ncbi:hypothetical protein U91I_04164 [alpha proteobacterium U9-1i]|nr:hypothetical protein U91I_04164 [alpha proteobacterium U9-1i]